ncbi:hypothetical protein QQF64_022306 [Cirrhinus molitorella]|uniref:Uncharacterized protein n=1 Tax=Cirrhinus molitorella TaxID=172907 RepID=A0ABR3LBT0_9TELE
MTSTYLSVSFHFRTAEWLDLKEDTWREGQKEKQCEKVKRKNHQKLKQQKKHPEGLKLTYNKTTPRSVAHAGVFVFLLHSVKPFLLRGQEPPANPPRTPSNAH